MSLEKWYMIPYFIVYGTTVIAALLYVVTIPWQWYTSNNRASGVSWWASLVVWARIIGAGLYLAMLLLYLPTIHFIINMIVFTLIVGIYMSYTLVKAQ